MSITQQLRIAQLRCLIANGATLVAHLNEWEIDTIGDREWSSLHARANAAGKELAGYRTELSTLVSAS